MVIFECDYMNDFIVNEWEIMWSCQARVKLYIFEWLTNKVLCSMYFDGLSSVKGKERTWTERKHHYAKSTTMAGETNIVCKVIKLWYV